MEEKIKAWQAKDPYETVDEYKARVTEATRDTKVKELLAEAEKKYISTYTQGIRFSDMQLKPYDADNRAFLIESKFGELIVPVPREIMKRGFSRVVGKVCSSRNLSFVSTTDSWHWQV